MANDSIYGLGGAVFSRDIPKAIGVAKRIRTGTVWINDYHLLNALAPFGGYKQSGVGRELGPTACSSTRRSSTSTWTSRCSGAEVLVRLHSQRLTTGGGRRWA